MDSQPPSIDEIQTKYKEGSSSGAKSGKKPPLPGFKTSPLVDGTHVLPINNQERFNEAAAATNAIIGRLSLMTNQEVIEYERSNGRNIPDNVDIKKLKRTIANRLSAQKSRLKKSHQVDEMENKVRELEASIINIKIQIESNQKTQETSRMQNTVMKQRLDYLSNKSNLRNKEIEKKKAETLWLREFLLLMKQNALNAEEKKMRSLFVGHYEQMLPALQIQQEFNIHPNREPQNLGEIGMGGRGDTSYRFSNMEDSIEYQQSNNPDN